MPLGRSSTGCPGVEGSTSPTRPSTGTPTVRWPTRWPCASSTGRSPRTDISYAGWRDLTNRFASALRSLGVGPEDRVFVLTGREPALYIAVLGALKNRSVACPLFSAFGPEPIRQRLMLGDAKVLVTTQSLFRRKVAAILDSLPTLEHVLIVGGVGAPDSTGRIVDFESVLESGHADFDIEPTAPADMALLHFTSGTTGTPKGAVHVHEAVVAHHATGAMALDLHPDDVFWCTADPGWVTGTSYGIIAPLTHGVTSIVDTCEFDAERWYRVLEAERVSVWYTAPTAIRMLMRSGDDLPGRFDLGALALRGERRRAAQPRSGRVGRAGARLCRSTTTGGRPRPAGS